MATGPWNSFVPLGKLTITAAGTTTSLAANCGPLAGQVSGTQASPNRLGQALRGIEEGREVELRVAPHRTCDVNPHPRRCFR